MGFRDNPEHVPNILLTLPPPGYPYYGNVPPGGQPYQIPHQMGGAPMGGVPGSIPGQMAFRADQGFPQQPGK